MANTVRRRIQVTGRSTYIISLPKEWARNTGIRQGSEVLIEVLPDYSLKITPADMTSKREAKVKTIVLKKDNIGSTIIEVLSAYLAGYNTIILSCSDSCVSVDDLKRIISIVKNRALGLEILEEKDNEVHLYSILDTSSLTLNNAIDKMINTTFSMLDDLTRLIKAYNEDLARSIIERDDIVDKLFLLSMRQLNQLLLGELKISEVGLSTLSEALYYTISIKSIERIADHAVSIAGNIARTGYTDPFSESIAILCNKTRDLFLLVSKGFRTLNKKYLNQALSMINELASLEEEVREKELRGKNTEPVVYLVLDSMRRMRAYSLDIVESSMNIIVLREYISNSSQSA